MATSSLVEHVTGIGIRTHLTLATLLRQRGRSFITYICKQCFRTEIIWWIPCRFIISNAGPETDHD